MHSTSSKLLGILTTLIQIFDVIIHAATDQLEFLRVTSNIVILIWLTMLFFGKFKTKSIASFGAVGLFLFLNFLFLAQAGLTNPEQGNAPRTMLFLLVILTTFLSTMLTIKYSEK